MIKIILIVFFTFFSAASAAQDMLQQTITNIYQLDVPERPQGTTVANRKFSLLLTAFSTGKKVAFHDLNQCEGNRSTVSWIRFD